MELGSGSPTKRQATNSKDRIYVAFLSLIGLVCLWNLLTPLTAVVSDETMRRFHLKTGSFSAWCAQQVVPSMYNFGNTAEVFAERPDFSSPDSIEPKHRARYMNHFPIRAITFGRDRYHLLMGKKDKWVRLSSSYGKRKLQTWYLVRYLDRGVFELVRMDEEKLLSVR